MSSIREWLEQIDLAEYADIFEAEQIRPQTLPHLTSEDLKEMGLPIGPRGEIIVALSQFGESGVEGRQEQNSPRSLKVVDPVPTLSLIHISEPTRPY